MRFSVFLLLILMTIICVFLAMFSRHGYFGLILLMPHAFAVWLLTITIRRSEYVRAKSIVTLFLLSWGFTAFFGVPDTQMRMASNINNHFANCRRLKKNPFHQGSDFETGEPPWFYVDNGGSPCPFMIYSEWGVMAGPLSGSGGRSYQLWVPGFSVEIHNHVHWNS